MTSHPFAFAFSCIAASPVAGRAEVFLSVILVELLLVVTIVVIPLMCWGLAWVLVTIYMRLWSLPSKVGVAPKSCPLDDDAFLRETSEWLNNL